MGVNGKYLKYMPIEIFGCSYSEGSDDLRDRINAFLEQDGIKLIDIKFTQVAGFNPQTKEPDGGWSALVIYEKQ